ncbi:unnamed protein product [Moneuplotes crassus]|uniref:Tubulin-tyrosine ligase family protein n=1 Tax=Euplotes crassus TaxID=5936 RepID=A0AAD1XLB4_EUPCR|nr:unnamed protein product [Moneuplotes crassus]
MNQVPINNLQKAKYSKPPIAIPEEKTPETAEQAEINQLKTKREQEEQQIAQRQKENIENLKKMLNQPDSKDIVIEDQEAEKKTTPKVKPPPTKDSIENLKDKLDSQKEEQRNHQQNNQDLCEKEEKKKPNRHENSKIFKTPSHETLKETLSNPNFTPEKATLEKSESHQLEEVPEKPILKNELSKKARSKSRQKKALPKTIKRVFPHCTDLKTWKKKNRLPQKLKIFKMFGGYQTIKNTLYDKGWIENMDKSSACFDLLWTIKQRDINFDTLRDGQVVNHFKNNGVITTKIGLCRNIGKVLNFNNVDVDTFFPKCFALKDEGEWEEFLLYYKLCKAEGILKKFKNKEIVDPDMLDVAMTVCRRNLLELDDIIDKPFKSLISDDEWKILKKSEKRSKKNNRGKKTTSLVPVKRSNIHQSPKPIPNILNSKRDPSYKSPSIVNLKLPEIEKSKLYSTVKETKGFFTDSQVKKEVLKSMIETQRPVETFLKEKSLDQPEVVQNNPPDMKKPSQTSLMSDINTICERLGQKFPQFHINGEKNIWIIKPAGLSRGRGIQVFSNLDDIIEYTRGKEKNWIAQKYIENPMIVNQRKFDLRIWVFVSDLNPLTIWFWNKPYVRFPAADYNAENLKDRFVHLTNNSVAKYAKNVEVIGDGNMWYIEELSDYLKSQYGRDVWNEEIKEKVKNIIIYSLQSVQDLLDTRKGSTEMLGYDIMIDENMTPWLIEVNSSPTMEFSTGVTTHLATNVMQSVVKILSDYVMAPKGANKKDIDTGDFELIHKGKKITENGINKFGLDFCCEGRRIYH